MERSSVPITPRVYLDAEVRPYRSLSRSGFLLLMALLAGVSFVAGAFYVSIGAWPVVGFFGLDVLLVWFAFRLSYRQARLTERVRVTADRLDVIRQTPAGRRLSWTLPTYWTRVRIDEPVEHSSQIELVSRGQSLIVGSFLAPKERSRLADQLKAAIAEAREERFDPAAEPQGSGGAP